jgi:hypothetical protein
VSFFLLSDAFVLYWTCKILGHLLFIRNIFVFLLKTCCHLGHLGSVASHQQLNGQINFMVLHPSKVFSFINGCLSTRLHPSLHFQMRVCVVEKYCGNVLNVEKGNRSILAALFSAVLSLSIICGSNHWTNVKSGTCGSCLPSNQTRRFLHRHGPCIQGASLGEPRML